MSDIARSPDQNIPPREGLIDTAVRFLANPNIADRPYQQKQSFLKSKGLTDEEISVACERANVVAGATQRHPDVVLPMYPVTTHTVAPIQQNFWMRLRGILHTLALLGGLGYVVYWIYKAYIEPFLFGRPKPKKSTEESLSSIEAAISNVSKCTAELKAEIHSELIRISHERETGAVRSLADIKSDIATVKGLLLSRQQFPSAPSSSALRGIQSSKPSIPTWQMSAEQKNGLKDDDEQNQVKDSHSQSHHETQRDVSSDECSTVKSFSSETGPVKESSDPMEVSKETNNHSNGSVDFEK